MTLYIYFLYHFKFLYKAKILGNGFGSNLKCHFQCWKYKIKFRLLDDGINI